MQDVHLLLGRLLRLPSANPGRVSRISGVNISAAEREYAARSAHVDRSGSLPRRLEHDQSGVPGVTRAYVSGDLKKDFAVWWFELSNGECGRCRLSTARLEIFLCGH